MTFAFGSNQGVGPTVGGFIEFVTNVMNPPSPFDPNTSIYVVYAYNMAVQMVNQGLSFVPGLPGVWNIYSLATYNLAADTLIAITPDPPDAPIYQNGQPYWEWLRNKYNVLAFIPGIVQSTSDEGTSVSYELPDAYKGYTIGDIQNTKTSYGRAYLAYASSWGTLWGLT